MSKRAALMREVFKGIARASKSYTIEFGPMRATGVPAILIGSATIVAAAGLARLLARTAERLPETLREANVLAQTVRGDRPRLNP